MTGPILYVVYWVIEKGVSVASGIMKYFLVVFAFLGLAGCRNTIEGTLQVDRAFSAKSVQKLPCNPEAGDPCYAEKIIQVNPGQYGAKISMKSGTEIEVQIQSGKGQTLKVRTPNDLAIPENGSFAVSSRQSGQPFDLRGVVTTSQQDSEIYRRREACTVERWENQCFPTPQGLQCSNVLRTYPGFREVEFYHADSVQVLDVVLTSVTDGVPLASFKGEKQTSQTRYTYQGPCW